MTRGVGQPLEGEAVELPPGTVYLGVVLHSPPPPLDAALRKPSPRAHLSAVELTAQPRVVAGQSWVPVPHAAAEVLELLDADTGALVTLIRAPFVPRPGPAAPLPIVGQIGASEKPGDDLTLLEDAEGLSDVKTRLNASRTQLADQAIVGQPRGPYERRDPHRANQ